MKDKIKVMLVEDHPQYRDSISFAMELEPDIEPIIQFGTADQALRSLQNTSNRSNPDVILLDLNLPGISGIEALPYFRAELPKTKIIVLTQSISPGDVLSAIEKGAAGYLLKSSRVDQISEAIRTAINGGGSLDSSVAMHIMKRIRSQAPAHVLGQNKALSKREMEILTLLSEGLIKKEIADRLGISINTVITHIAHIYEKLEVNTAAGAVSKAHRSGLFPQEN